MAVYAEKMMQLMKWLKKNMYIILKPRLVYLTVLTLTKSYWV